MAERRRYTKRQKATAVIAAEMSSVSAAAEAQGIPRTTLEAWFTSPEYITLRQKTREEQGEYTRALGFKVLIRIDQRLADFEPRDLTILYGVLADKSQLMTGAATARVESRELVESFNDHERESLRALLDSALQEASSVAGD